MEAKQPDRTCPQCRLILGEKDIYRCPRCNKSLLTVNSCSGGCIKCNSNNKCN